MVLSDRAMDRRMRVNEVKLRIEELESRREDENSSGVTNYPMFFEIYFSTASGGYQRQKWEY